MRGPAEPTSPDEAGPDIEPVASVSEARWALVVAHRERLLGIARRRCADIGEAEDCVHEAMLQCAAYPALDEARVAQLLTTMTVRKCVDAHRGRARRTALAARALTETVTPGPEERACDRAEARWLAGHLESLPAQQRSVLLARADGASPADIAVSHAMTYKAVESTLSRARRTLRAALASASCVAAVLAAAARKLRFSAAPAMTATALVVVAGVALGPLAPESPAPARRIPEARSVHVVDVADRTGRSDPSRAQPPSLPRRPRAVPAARTPRVRRSGEALVHQQVSAGDTDGQLTVEGDNDDYTPIERVQHCVEEGAVLTLEEIRCRYPDESR